jgi:hypothetical protein
MTIRNLTNAPATILGRTIGPSGWQPLPPQVTDVMLIVDVFQVCQCWEARTDLCVLAEILADGSDRTATALAHAGFVAIGLAAVERGTLRVLVTPTTLEQLKQLQDDAPTSL